MSKPILQAQERMMIERPPIVSQLILVVLFAQFSENNPMYTKVSKETPKETRLAARLTLSSITGNI
jgi:hypothetical protein